MFNWFSLGILCVFVVWVMYPPLRVALRTCLNYKSVAASICRFLDALMYLGHPHTDFLGNTIVFEGRIDDAGDIN